MKFDQALAEMKNGARVKLPSWAGYWTWDPMNKTILMHCRPSESDTGRPVMDIRESQRVEFTIRNILSEDWMIAGVENSPILGGERTMPFGDALMLAKRYGARIARKGWNGKDQYVEIASGISYKAANGDVINAEHDAIGNQALAFVGTSGVQIGWLASQADMLSEDWYVKE